MVEKAKDVEKNVAKEPIKQVYLGPSFKDVVHQRVYIGELPKALKDLIEKCPMAKHLVVDLKDYVNGLNDLKEKGSVINTAVLKVREFFMKEVKE